jgi:hypothetical protein
MTQTPTPVLPTRNTTAFFAQAAISFGTAALAVGIGITYLPVDRWTRGFLAVGCLFLVSSAFTLAKCVRDQQEQTQLYSRVDQARLEKALAEHDPFASRAA